MTQPLPTVWVFGDQLHRRIGALRDREAGDCRVLLVESELKITSKRWHRQRIHLVLSAMRHFAQELRDEGFDVDLRRAPNFVQGYRQHCEEFDVDRVVVMEPMSWDVTELLGRLRPSGRVETLPNDQFFCHYSEFGVWADGRKRFKLEDFYRWQRERFGVLMDDAVPVGGKWNVDHDNREKPPKDGRSWPAITHFELDDIDVEVINFVDSLGGDVWGGAERTAHGLSPASKRSYGWTSSSRPASNRSARMRTRCSPTNGSWRTRCCRRA